MFFAKTLCLDKRPKCTDKGYVFQNNCIRVVKALNTMKVLNCLMMPSQHRHWSFQYLFTGDREKKKDDVD